jgi:uncharacterized flavoprotein (TIGR03862 family)
VTHLIKTCAIIGAEKLAEAGYRVTVYDRMANPGRKFLLAGRGGLNLTHTDEPDEFMARYREASSWLWPYIEEFSPDDLRDWCDGLGEDSFAGSSGRVFPKSFKASPLLRAWLRRLDTLGVAFCARHDWQGWESDGALRFRAANGQEVLVKPDATLLALGGASWPKLGADGSWTRILKQNDIVVSPLQPANAGVLVEWSDLMKTRFAGAAIKRVVAFCGQSQAKGEAIITEKGLEGGVVYSLGPDIRRQIETEGHALIHLDLRRDLPLHILTERLSKPRGKMSVSTWLHKAAGLAPAAIALFREERATGTNAPFDDPNEMAKLLKHLPIHIQGISGLERAISTAGGIALSQLDDHLMLIDRPGVFVAGEMLDWEAPTGGYLLQACFSTGVAAAKGMTDWLNRPAF